ncbi:hypothetical protein [Bradyrhizobium sp. BTAi1]|uniref:hypothetical protein n=1 Tax=Bradyrhizobium sp. (strain BTAi1 / ATCC BAA-1182) TaxID=288000 RepID=UPI00005E0F73|nr:hypothetical protein [Bradyrhizobium sp. BTAi1]ABQ35438.1 putative membrane protein of unknown function [Bradyrhizobium sp. BTAi1]
MPAITLILGLVSVGLLCRALFKLAVHALPFFVAVSTSMAVLSAGVGIAGAFLVGLTAAALTLTVGRILFVTSRSPLMRACVAAAFLVPAAMAGRHTALGVAFLAGPSPLWCEIIGWLGALLAGGCALHELLSHDLPRPSRTEQGGDRSLHSLRL